MERRSTSAGTLLATLFLCSFAHPQNNPFPKIGEIRLTERLSALGEPPLGHMSISALSFSPDGTRLAIAVQDVANRDVLKIGAVMRHYILVLEVAKPEETVYFGKTQGGVLDIAWSSDSGTLGYAAWLTRIPSGETCRLPGAFRGFLSATEALTTVPEVRPYQTPPGMLPTSPASSQLPPPTVLGVTDFQCKVHQEWATGRNLAETAVSPDGQTLAAADIRARQLLFAPIEEARRQLELSGVRAVSTQFGNGIFLGTGHLVWVNDLVCGMFVTQPAVPKLPVECWSPQTAKVVRRTPSLWSGGDVVISAGGGRIAISDAGHHARPRAAQVRGVFDVKTGKMVADWLPDPEFEESVQIMPAVRRGIALSPDGKMLAEAGPEAVLLYRLP